MTAVRREIRLAGSGGQGLITGMAILSRALALEGRCAAQSQSYEPTSRGGFCYSDLVVAEDDGDYPLATGLDAIAALSQIGLDRSLELSNRARWCWSTRGWFPNGRRAASIYGCCR